MYQVTDEHHVVHLSPLTHSCSLSLPLSPSPFRVKITRVDCERQQRALWFFSPTAAENRPEFNAAATPGDWRSLNALTVHRPTPTTPRSRSPGAVLSKAPWETQEDRDGGRGRGRGRSTPEVRKRPLLDPDPVREQGHDASSCRTLTCPGDL